MKLLTKAILKRLPKLYITGEIELNDKVVQVKFFAPWSNWTWYGVEYSPEEKLFFGCVRGFEMEWGYFRLSELEEVEGPDGLKIERDLYFKPIKMGKILGLPEYQDVVAFDTKLEGGER